MTRIAGRAFAIVLVLLALAVGSSAFKRDVHPAAAISSTMTSSTTPAAETYQGFLHGRITTVDGATYEGRLRWGGDQEAFWGDYFNGTKRKNPWAAHVPPELVSEERRPIEIFGFTVGYRKRGIDVGRLFMARFGDIARIDVHGRNVHVTLKSGTAFDLDRFEAGDIDDGVRVWDRSRGVTDLDSLRIRSIELLPTPSLADAPRRLYGTVRTAQADFTGFIQWDRKECVGPDGLDGRTADGEIGLRFDTIRSIARRSRDSSLVTLLDGREIVLSGTREVAHDNLGIYVDDLRYGRVLVSWGAFERVDFSAGDSGPAYGDFPPGRPLMGSVTTRAGGRLTGRLVYDLDESETVETLDAPSQGVDYTIPFGRIASIVLPDRDARDPRHAGVILHDGEELRLERAGDLGERNAGLLVFVDGRERPEYVPWTDVARVDLDRPPAAYPPLGVRHRRSRARLTSPERRPPRCRASCSRRSRSAPAALATAP